jgi:hypothetical protein
LIAFLAGTRSGLIAPQARQTAFLADWLAALLAKARATQMAGLYLTILVADVHAGSLEHHEPQATSLLHPWIQMKLVSSIRVAASRSRVRSTLSSDSVAEVRVAHRTLLHKFQSH